MREMDWPLGSPGIFVAAFHRGRTFVGNVHLRTMAPLSAGHTLGAAPVQNDQMMVQRRLVHAVACP